MTQNIYTLLIYVAGEEGWHDRCGDFHSGKESLFEKSYFNDKKEAAKALGKANFNYSSGEVTLLINGLDINHMEGDEFLPQNEYLALQQEYDEIDNEALDITKKLNEAKKEKELQEKIQREEQDTLRKNKERENIENKERAELAKLMAKYGNK